jgi:hypothetical protein
VDTDFIVADQTLNDELIATSFDEFKREFLLRISPRKKKMISALSSEYSAPGPIFRA